MADQHKYGIVRNFCGHGTGRLLHMKPLVQTLSFVCLGSSDYGLNQIIHYPNDEKLKMVPGMVFTIEPIFAEKSGEVYTWEDHWTAATVDGGW